LAFWSHHDGWLPFWAAFSLYPALMTRQAFIGQRFYGRADCIIAEKDYVDCL
jgi:hypothetical protein